MISDLLSLKFKLVLGLFGNQSSNPKKAKNQAIKNSKDYQNLIPNDIYGVTNIFSSFL